VVSAVGAARPPGTVDESALKVLLDISGDGLAVLDDRGRFRMLNPAAERILGRPAEDLLGRKSPFDPSAPREGGQTSWAVPDGRRRDLEYRVAPVGDGGYAVWFSDVTDMLRQQERLTAIVRAASSVADLYSLRATLDAVAHEVVMTAHISAVQILALDDPEDELRVLGMAGFGDARDFTDRLSACRRRGARVRFMDAYRTRRPIVVPHRKPAIMADPRWAPLHEIMGYPDWDCFVSMPLIVRSRCVGVINAYYAPGEDPGPASLAFLEAMAGHAAVAIDTAALLADTRSHERRRLARDLHDSVVQQLFSMRMQAKALRAQLDRPNPDLEVVGRGAEELAELTQSALADLRGLVYELRPLDLAEHGLVEAVRAHAESLSARSGLAIDVQVAGGLRFDAALDQQEDLYRIIQEALHNVVKHAEATEVVVRFDRLRDAGRRKDAPGERWRDDAENGLLIEVTDNGKGLGDRSRRSVDELGRHTLGLVSMRERAQRWGGRVAAGPRADRGWTVAVWLPFPRARRWSGGDDAPRDGSENGR
jgi:signal transduction histidine kinase